MKKTAYGVLFLALVGIAFASCEKESFVQDTNAKNEAKQTSSKALTFNYAVGAETLNQQLFRKKYDFNTGIFTSGTTFNNFLYHGVGAYDDDLATLEKVSATESWVYYDSGSVGSVAGPVKYLGADIVMDEIELLDDNINKLYALKGGKIYKLTYTGSNFDATEIYSYTTSGMAPRRFSIAPTTGNDSFIRLYTALSVASKAGSPPAMTTLSYLDISVTPGGVISLPTNVTPQIPGLGNLSSFTAKDYFNMPALFAKYYVVVDKDIYELDTPTTLTLVSSFTNSVRDCSFYHY
jgi:hypothetical protein